MSALAKHAFAAVRMTDGREWIDASAVSLLPELVKSANAALHRRIPTWQRHNPVVRIVPVTITEEITP